jgi:hypothetical protein
MWLRVMLCRVYAKPRQRESASDSVRFSITKDEISINITTMR